MTRKAIYDPRYRALVALISDTRKRQGLTQSALGQRLRLSRQTVQKIESCEVRLDLVRYVALCRILGLNAGQLLGRLEEPSDEDDPLTCQRPLAGEQQYALLATLLATFPLTMTLYPWSNSSVWHPFYWPLYPFTGAPLSEEQEINFTGHLLATFFPRLALINRFGTF